MNFSLGKLFLFLKREWWIPVIFALVFYSFLKDQYRAYDTAQRAADYAAKSAKSAADYAAKLAAKDREIEALRRRQHEPGR